jgi:hypothetical protein
VRRLSDGLLQLWTSLLVDRPLSFKHERRCRTLRCLSTDCAHHTRTHCSSASPHRDPLSAHHQRPCSFLRHHSPATWHSSSAPPNHTRVVHSIPIVPTAVSSNPILSKVLAVSPPQQRQLEPPQSCLPGETSERILFIMSSQTLAPGGPGAPGHNRCYHPPPKTLCSQCKR